MKRSIRKKLNRSGSRECQICKDKQILVEHHIEGRDIPNATNASNLCYICSNCHVKVHYGLIIIEGHFQTSNGWELLWHEANKESFTGKNAKTHLISTSN